MSDERTIVVTGASRGLGRALVAGLASRGHRVAGCARSKEGLAGLPEAVLTDAVDVSDDNAVQAWAERVVEALGPPDLLVNNAALMNAPAPLWEVPADAFDRMLAVNVAGVANVVRAFAPAMIARGKGVFVHLSSGWGRSTSPDVGPYCTTKWAIEGYARSLADDLPPGLASVALNPGIIDTDMLRTCWSEAASAYEGPAAWAERAIPFLLGMSARHNGQALTAP